MQKQNLSNARIYTEFKFKYIPFVCTHAKAGYPSDSNEEDYLKSISDIPVFVNREYDGKLKIFEVEGDSMNNGTNRSYFDKDKILCKEVEKEMWNKDLHINDWLFVIIHKTKGIVFKQIIDHNIETGDITCHSFNPDFADFELNLQDVSELYSVFKLVDRDSKLKNQ